MGKKRKGGSGTVRKRKDGRWEGRHVIGYDEKGLPKTKGVLAKTKAECVAKLKALQESCQAPQPQKQKADMKFGDWMNFWYEHYAQTKLSANTKEGYGWALEQHIIPTLGEIPLNRLSQKNLQQFYSNLKTAGRKRMTARYGEGLSDRTVRIIHTVCHLALDRAVGDGLIRRNPTDQCVLPSTTKKEMKILEQEEIQRLLIQAKEEGYYELCLLALSTGLRRGELLALQWTDLNFTTGELKIDKQVTRTDGKLQISTPKTTASIRTIILPTAITDVLLAHQKNTQSRWLFPSPKIADSPLDPASVRKKLQKILEHAQCKQVRFHDLRHTFCSNALAHGMDVKTLSTIVGHISAKTTLNTYAHSTEAMKQQAALHIDKGIGKVDVAAEDVATTMNAKETEQPFEPYKGQRRKAGTGCITQLSEQLWEGRYSPRLPDRKQISRNIYAKTEVECEEKLKGLIAEMKAEILAMKNQTKPVPL